MVASRGARSVWRARRPPFAVVACTDWFRTQSGQAHREGVLTSKLDFGTYPLDCSQSVKVVLADNYHTAGRDDAASNTSGTHLSRRPANDYSPNCWRDRRHHDHRQ